MLKSLSGLPPTTGSATPPVATVFRLVTMTTCLSGGVDGHRYRRSPPSSSSATFCSGPRGLSRLRVSVLLGAPACGRLTVEDADLRGVVEAPGTALGSTRGGDVVGGCARSTRDPRARPRLDRLSCRASRRPSARLARRAPARAGRRSAPAGLFERPAACGGVTGSQEGTVIWGALIRTIVSGSIRA